MKKPIPPQDGLLLQIDRVTIRRERCISRQISGLLQKGGTHTRAFGRKKPGGRRRLETPRLGHNTFVGKAAISPKRLFNDILDYTEGANAKKITRTGNWR